MPDLHLQITLDQSKELFRPGDILRGTVTITSPGGLDNLKQAELLVFWRTTGIGTTDEGAVYKEDLVGENIKLPSYFTKEFSVTLPQLPWTYAGRLIKIEWLVGLYVRQGWKGRPETEISFQLRPEGMGPVKDYSGQQENPGIALDN